MTAPSRPASPLPTPETAPPPTEVAALEPLPRDLTSPQFTARAVITGMLLGGTLSLCNIYGGLKVGWGFNMSITAALLAFGFWQLMGSAARTRPFTLLENNINQTAASAGASVSSAGLVSAVPAWTILTGDRLSWPWLSLWVLSVCLVGIAVAVGLRRQMIVEEKLPFASGIAAAQTLKEIYAKGKEAVGRVQVLLGAAAIASAVKLTESLAKLPKLGIPGTFSLKSSAGGASSASLYNLGFALDPTLLMVGVGAIVGLRATLSLMLGAVVAWGLLAPWILREGWVTGGAAGAVWYGPLVGWLLWPGVAMMVTASLTSFAFSGRSFIRAFKPGAAGSTRAEDTGEVSRNRFLGGLALALVLSVACQYFLFGIAAHIATLGVLVTFVLAVVASRVSGETAITPVGPIGKVTQLLFGILAPGQPAANLMAANVTGGAASQCGDLLHDLKAGHLLGASPQAQSKAQLWGVVAGALMGSAAYLILIPDPKGQLMTPEWPAPAAATWKAVAELFMRGFEAMPPGATTAMLVGAGLGVVFALMEKLLPKKASRFLPSAASMGLAFVIPAYNSLSMFLGALVAALAIRFAKSWSARFLIVAASGLIAGESLTGVGLALKQILFP